MIAFIRRHPIAVSLALSLHLMLGVLLTSEFFKTESQVIKVSSQQTDSIVQPTVMGPPLETFAVDRTLVQQQIDRIQAEEEVKRLEQQRLIDQAKASETRLAETRREQEEQARRAEQARRQADIERQRMEAERKRATEEQLRADEARRLAQEADKRRQEAEKSVAKVAEEAEKRRLLAEQQAAKITQEAERQRQAEERRLRELEALQREAQLQAQREADRQKQLQEEIKRQEAESQRMQAEALASRLQREQQEAEAERRRLLAEEESRLREVARQRELVSLRDSYISAISAKVRENWRTPADISALAQCELAIVQERDGKVVSVRTENCNSQATTQFRQAAERAVFRASPLPRPAVDELFERNIRFVFKP